MNAHDLAGRLKTFTGHLGIVINDMAATTIETASGRVRRDVMFTSFREMPDKPRDTVIVLRAGIGPAITVKQAIDFLSQPEHADVPVFINGEPVAGFEPTSRRLNPKTGRHVLTQGGRGSDAMVSPVHWSELSTGDQAVSQVWTEQA